MPMVEINIIFISFAQMLELNVYDHQSMGNDSSFRISIFDPTPGAKLGQISKAVVTVVNDDDLDAKVSRLVAMTNSHLDGLRVDRLTWREQFRNATSVNGGDLETATPSDYIMHILSFGWKVLHIHFNNAIFLIIKYLTWLLSIQIFFHKRFSFKFLYRQLL